jgi:CheY-like chemotaxis protein
MVTVPDRPKVLVIDDDPGMLGKLEAMLDTWGFRAVTASNADTAFELLVQDEEVHIVVVDYMLPGMNGFELCRKIRAKLHSTPLHLLILTAKARCFERRGAKFEMAAGLRWRDSHALLAVVSELRASPHPLRLCVEVSLFPQQRRTVTSNRARAIPCNT